MQYEDIRWIQRFSNYTKALTQLENAIELMKKRELSILEKQGTIQAFEYTHELAWKTLKDFLEDRGNRDMYGSRDATRRAFSYGLIEEGHVWMEMIKSRNLTSHTYNEEIADEIILNIKDSYVNEFKKMKNKMEEMKKKESS